MFGKLRWSFRPPATVAPPPPKTAAPVIAPRTDSRAAKLLDRFGQLKDTAKYLEDCILARCQGIGATLDLNRDPELALALSRIYGTDEPPEAISVDMYNHLLDAELGITRAEIVLADADSAYEISPVQKADLQMATGRFEDAMIDSGKFEHQLPGTLRELKSDRVIFDNIQDGIREYPVLQGMQSGNGVITDVTPDAVLAGDDFQGDAVQDVQVVEEPEFYEKIAVSKDDKKNEQLIKQILKSIPPDAAEVVEEDPTTLDVSQDTSDNLNERCDAWEDVYGGIFDVTAQADSVYRDLQSVSEQYMERPLRELAYVLASLNALKIFFHQPKLKDLKATLASVVMPRLISEASKLMFWADRLVRNAVRPVENMLGSFGRLFAEIQKVSGEAAYLAAGGGSPAGGLTGLVQTRMTGKNYMPPAMQTPVALNTVSAGIQTLGNTLRWSVNEATRQANFAEASLFRLVDNKLDADGDRVEVMQALRSLDGLINITQSFLKVGANSGPGPIGTAQNSLNQVISQNGVSSLPTVNFPPVPNANAQAVLARQGYNPGGSQ